MRYFCWDCGEDMRHTGIKTPDGDRYECCGCKMSAPEKGVIRHQQLFRAAPALRDCVANVVLCWERDNVPGRVEERPSGKTVLVGITVKAYERMVAALSKGEV